MALVAAITFVTGLLFLLLALFKMGWISQFLSKAVITGFLFGAAIEVVIGELPKITGTSAEGSNSWQKLFSWLQESARYRWDDAAGGTHFAGGDLWAAVRGPAEFPGRWCWSSPV